MTGTVKRRSQAWFGGLDKDGFIHRSWMKNQGHPDEMFDGRPVIGICNTASDLTPCNTHFRGLVEHVKRGVYEAGGFPLEFPVSSCGESNLRPTAMMFRNLAAMDVEEAIRGNPIDGVVLLCGCDKTTPSLVMGAASCDLPAIVLSGGPMLNGRYRGRTIGSGTDVWKLSEDVRAGVISLRDFMAAESAMSRSAGHCMTMGTASTMASMVEALGLALPGNAALPAVDAGRVRLAHLVGRRAVALVHEDLRMSRILTPAAFANAIRVNGAVGGSTNAVIHLLAIAGRTGVPLSLDDWDRLGRDVPCLLDLMPSGRFLMEDFCYAGGVPALMTRITDLLDLDALTVTGETVGVNLRDAVVFDDEVIRPRTKPLTEHGGIAVLRGNLAPGGAVIKPSAASPALMRHRGRAVVFDTIDDYKARIDDPALDIDAGCVMVLRNCGPARLPRHGRGRQHGPAAQAPRPRGPRHGASLGRAYERDGIRHRRASRRAGGGRRRPAGAGRERGHDRARRRGTAPAPRCRARGPGRAAGRMDAARAGPGWRVPAALSRPRARGGHGR